MVPVAQGAAGIIAIGRSCPVKLREAVASTGSLEGVTELVRPLLYTHAACINVHRIKSTQQLIVVKTYVKSQLSERESHQVEQEILLQRDADHNHVVAFLLAFDRGSNRHVVMEYCGDGDLRNSLTGRSEVSLRTTVIVPLLQVLAHIHDQGIVHRDIKPDNIFLQQGSAKLGDFGLAVSLNTTHSDISDISGSSDVSTSAICSHSLSHTASHSPFMKRSCSTGGACSSSGSHAAVPDRGLTRFASTGMFPSRQAPLLLQASGTPAYTAPEVLEALMHGRTVAPTISPKNDIWGLGLVALEAMTGRHPFAGPTSTSGSAMLAVLAAPRVHVEHDCISPAMQDWLQLALAKDPSKRGNARQLLSHHWVTGSGSGSGRSTPVEGAAAGVAALGCRSADHMSGSVLGVPLQHSLWGLGGISSWED